ncbi:MAG: proline dehydrogenase family protein [Bacteroidota bacterium]
MKNPDLSLSVPFSFEDTSIAFSYKSDNELRKSYRLFQLLSNKTLSDFGAWIMNASIKAGLPVTGIVKATTFDQFCGGETIGECFKTVEQLWEYRIGTILDYSVEGERTKTGFERTKEEIIKTIENSAGEEKIPFCVFKVTGLGSSEILVKVQSGLNLTKEEEINYQELKVRVLEICETAYKNNVRILIDAEESWIQNPVDELALDMMRRFNREKGIVYNTYQMYRADMLENLNVHHQIAVDNNHFLGVKLVRGAYMEKERERAEEMSYKDPIQPSKESTDSDFNTALKFCVEHGDRIYLVSGTHNEYSNYYLSVLMDENKLDKGDERFFFAQLYGMSDNISFNLAHQGYNVAKYVPYGPIKKVMPYLTRRAEENTSISGQTSRELTLLKKEMTRRFGC